MRRVFLAITENIKASQYRFTSFCCSWHFSRNIRNRTSGHVRPANVQISLRIRAVWSEFSLAAFWIAMDANFFMRTTKTLTGLRGCAGWYESSFGAQVTRYIFSRCSVFFVLNSEIRYSPGDRNVYVCCPIYQRKWDKGKCKFCITLLLVLLKVILIDLSGWKKGIKNKSYYVLYLSQVFGQTK